MRQSLLGLLAAIIVTTPAHRALSQQVGRYGLFETVITNSRTYSNPFKDTTLTATFTSPTQRQFSIYGYHDGGQTWRLRFMPDEIGAWSFTASFSDGAPGATGVFQCVESSLHGPLVVNADNRLWFQHADGTPFYMRAFHLWQVCRLDSRGVLLSTLDYLHNQGFNTIVGPHVTEAATGIPWPRIGGALDFSRFELTLWQQLDKVLVECAARGMVLIPFSIMGGTNGVPKIDTTANRELFMRYWVARWGGFWNATYQPTSEWEEGYSSTEVLQILNRIVELDGGRHLVSVHSWDDSTSTIQQASAYMYHTVQDKLTDYNPTKYTWFVNLYNGVHKPILAHECLWEGNLYQKEASLDMTNMRRAAWVIALSGGQINYADEVSPPRQYQTPGSSSPIFSDLGMEMTPCGWLYPYLNYLGGFLQSLPFSALTLQPGLSSTGMCLAQTGTRYVTYAPYGAAMTLNLASAAGTLDARWFNPRTGEIGQAFQVQGGAVRAFTPPDTNDWALYVQDAGTVLPPAPGPVASLLVEPGTRKNTLSWTNPADLTFAATMIRFSTTEYPASPTDGNLLVEKIAGPGSSDSYVHTGLAIGPTYYYSVFTRNWFMVYGPAEQASGTPLPPGDFDQDGDVDQSDFGVFQACQSGPGFPYPDGCEYADFDTDGDVDGSDLTTFRNCMSGPNRSPEC